MLWHKTSPAEAASVGHREASLGSQHVWCESIEFVMRSLSYLLIASFNKPTGWDVPLMAHKFELWLHRQPMPWYIHIYMGSHANRSEHTGK